MIRITFVLVGILLAGSVWAQTYEKYFQQIDADSDRFVVPEEMARFMSWRIDKAEASVAAHDSDGDGKLSLAEYMAIFDPPVEESAAATTTSEPCACALDCSLINRCEIQDLPFISRAIIPKYTNVEGLEVCRCNPDCTLMDGPRECKSNLENRIFTSIELYEGNIYDE